MTVDRAIKAIAAIVLLIGTSLLATISPAAAATEVTVNGAGDLIITGDNSAQYVSIGVTPTGLVVDVESGSSIATHRIDQFIRDVKVNLKGGNDGFAINYQGDVQLPRDLIVNLGSGFNSTELSNLEIGRNFRLTDGWGPSIVESSAGTAVAQDLVNG